MKKHKLICCMGITNRLNGGSAYTLFLDYDEITLSKVKNELVKLNDKWRIGYSYILDSKGDDKHYQVMCPAIFSPYDILGIYWDSKWCDVNYKTSFFKLKEKTLRISKKGGTRQLEYPKIATVMKFHTGRKYSKPHLNFIETFISQILPKNIRYYKSDLEVVKYFTRAGE